MNGGAQRVCACANMAGAVVVLVASRALRARCSWRGNQGAAQRVLIVHIPLTQFWRSVGSGGRVYTLTCSGAGVHGVVGVAWDIPPCNAMLGETSLWGSIT